MRSGSRFAASAVIGLALTACTSTISGTGHPGTNGASAESSGGPAAANGAKGWTRFDITPVSQPVAVNHHVIFLAVDDKELEIVALDGKTGKSVWADDVSTSDIAPGIGAHVIADDKRVYYLRAGIGSAARLAAADAATGKVAWQGPVGDYNSWPFPCPGRLSAVCLSGSTRSGSVGVFSFDRATGKALPTLDFGEYGRSLGGGLFGQYTDPEVITAYDGDNVLWTKQTDELFTHTGASTNFGWIIRPYPTLRMHIGSVGAQPVSVSGSKVVSDMAVSSTIGIRSSDGTVLWRDAGSKFVCGALPCATTGMRPDNAFDKDTSTLAVGLRIRVTGTVSFDSKSPLTSGDIDIRTAVLEGFAPQTGKTMWKVALKPQGYLGLGRTIQDLGTTDSVLLQHANGSYRIVNLRTGKAAPAGPGHDYWCSEGHVYTLRRGFETASTTIHDYNSGGTLYPCNSFGSKLPSPTKAPVALAAQAAVTDGLAMWTDVKSVNAIPIG